MTQPHFHLLVNHLPIFFPVAALLILVAGIVLKNEIIKRVAYALLVVSAMGAFVASSSGEGAEEAIEHTAGISENLIHIHEESSEVFSLLSYILGAFSLVAMWASFKQKSFANLMAFAILIFVAVNLYFAKQTGTSGGEIIHQEIRTNATQSNSNNSTNEDD
ncbi:MAG: hypothetical protein IPI46_09795 [Bacteroidetes bacterium]|nr:hypothetical protein [Bacteroidota bacterium]